MLIELATLPPAVKTAVLQQNAVVEFAENGQVVATFTKQTPPTQTDSLMSVAGLLKGRGVDGLAFERQLRSEWE